jgi:hypothetical protein
MLNNGWKKWLLSLTPAAGRDRRKPGRPRPPRLALEHLEDRLTPAVQDLTTAGTFATLQAAVNAANPGDTLMADAGTYAEQVTINKSITLEGAQHGVDARNRSGPESIVTGTGNGGLTPFNITASDVTIDGFTVQGATNPNLFGAGIRLAPGVSGSHIINDILEDNVVGLFLTNTSSADQAVVQNDLFQNNTQSGPAGGTDIYTDQFVAGSGGVNNALIEGNTFTNAAFVEQAFALGVSNTGTTPFTAITFSNNSVTNHGRGVYFFGTSGATVTDNTITGASHYAVGLFGSNGTPANANFTISNNALDINGSGGAGVFLSDDTTPGFAYSGALTLAGDHYATGGTDRSVDNESATPIDATGETFNGVAASSATTGQLFAVADTVVDAIDGPAFGLVRLAAGNVYVTPNSFFAPTTTTPDIQRGIDAASAGDTVNVAAGTYIGQLDVPKAITLLGQGNTTVIRSPATLAQEFTSAGNPYKPIVYVHDTTATVNDLEIDGNGQGNANNRFVGLAYYNAGGTAENLTIIGVRDNPLDGVQHGVAIYAVDADAASRSLAISNSSLSDYQKGGIVVSGAGLTATITGNTVTGAGATTLIAQNGIEIASGAVATVTGNTVSGNEYGGTGSGADPAADVQATGVLLIGAGAGNTVSNNVLDGNDVGIYNNAAATTTIGTNTLGATTANRFEGIFLDQGNANVTGNTITGGNIGVAAFVFDGNTGNTGGTLTNNIIHGASVAAVVVGDTSTNASFTLQVVANNNDLSGNATGINNESTTLVDASGNWWGATTQAGVRADANNGVNVDYTPWLGSGTDISGAPGFQGDFSTLYVDAASPQSGAVGRVQEGVNLVTAGGTVNVVAGTYSENVSITKSLTLQGAGIGATVLDAGSATGLTLSGPASTVTVQGLSLTGTGAYTPVSASGLTTLTLSGVEATGGTGSSSISNVTNFTYTTGSGTTPDAITLTATQLQHTRGSVVQLPYNYSGVQSLTVNGGDGGNTVLVQGTAAGTSSQLNTGAGDDTVYVSSAVGNGGNLDGLRDSTLLIDAGGGSNVLTVNEASGSTPDMVTLNASSITDTALRYFIGYRASGGTFAGVNLQTGPGAYWVNVLGTAANASTAIINLGGDDTIAVNPNTGTGLGNLNGLAGPLTVIGEGGRDSVILTTLAGAASTLALAPGQGALTGPGYAVTLRGVTWVSTFGGAADSASFTATSGPGSFLGTPTYAYLDGAGFTGIASGFRSYRADSSGGGDSAYLYDSAGNATFLGTPTYAYLAGAGFTDVVAGFPTVVADADAGGDSAYLYGSPAVSNVFVSTPSYGYLSGPGYFDDAVGFPTVTATAGGANDTAYLSGAAGNVLVATSANAYLSGAGYFNDAAGFHSVYGYSGGNGAASLLGTGTSADTYVSAGGSAYLYGDAFFQLASGFASVSANPNAQR